MICVSWNGLGGYDRFLKTDEAEMKAIAAFFHQERQLGAEYGGYFYFLLCDEKRIITPLPFRALAFGGQWNGDPPYGKECACHFSLDTLSEYRLEWDWKAPK